MVRVIVLTPVVIPVWSAGMASTIRLARAVRTWQPTNWHLSHRGRKAFLRILGEERLNEGLVWISGGGMDVDTGQSSCDR